MLSGIKSSLEIHQISISNYFPVTGFCHLGKLPKDPLLLISPDCDSPFSPTGSPRHQPRSHSIRPCPSLTLSFSFEVLGSVYTVTGDLAQVRKVFSYYSLNHMCWSELLSLRSPKPLFVLGCECWTKAPAGLLQLQLQPKGKEIRVPEDFTLIHKAQNSISTLQITESRPQTNLKKSLVLGMLKLRICKKPEITCSLYYKAMEQNLEKPGNISASINQPSWRKTQMASTWSEFSSGTGEQPKESNCRPRLRTAWRD